MLSKNTPNHLAGWKYLLVLPLLGGMILGSSWNATAQDKNPKKSSQMAARVEKKLKEMGFEKTGTNTWTKDGISVMSTDSVSMDEINARLRKAEERKAGGMTGDGKKAFLVVEEMPTFQGGTIEDFRTWVQGQIKYPAEARVNKISGTVWISFVVDTTGRAVDLQIVRGAGPILDTEVIRAIKSAPLWTPGKQHGQLINVSFTIPVKFILDDQTVDPAKKDSASGRASAHKAQPAKSSVISETLNKGKITKRYISAGDIINRPDSSNTVMVEGTVEKVEEEYVFLIVEEMPTFQGGKLDDFRKWLDSNVKYPGEARAQNIEGIEYVSFIVNKEGKVIFPNIVRSVHPLLDAEVLRVLKSSPTWKAGLQRGEPVNVSFSVPVNFTLSGKPAKEEVKTKYVGKAVYENKRVFLIVEEMPKFQNGDIDDFVSWAQANVKYPQKAMEESKSGTVEVSFVVSNTGELTDIQITKSADPNLDEAVMNVVKSSPRWTSGKQRGKEVNVSFTIPIKFVLN